MCLRCALCGWNGVANSGLAGERDRATRLQRPESQRRCARSHRQETAGAKQTGESQISQTETAGRRSSETAGAIRKERGDPGHRRWKEQRPKKTGGDPALADGDRRGVRQRWAAKDKTY